MLERIPNSLYLITELQHGLRHIGVAGMLLAALAVFARARVLACTFAATALAAGFRTRGTGGKGEHEPIPRL